MDGFNIVPDMSLSDMEELIDFENDTEICTDNEDDALNELMYGASIEDEGQGIDKMSDEPEDEEYEDTFEDDLENAFDDEESESDSEDDFENDLDAELENAFDDEESEDTFDEDDLDSELENAFDDEEPEDESENDFEDALDDDEESEDDSEGGIDNDLDTELENAFDDEESEDDLDTELENAFDDEESEDDLENAFDNEESENGLEDAFDDEESEDNLENAFDNEESENGLEDTSEDDLEGTFDDGDANEDEAFDDDIFGDSLELSQEFENDIGENTIDNEVYKGANESASDNQTIQYKQNGIRENSQGIGHKDECSEDIHFDTDSTIIDEDTEKRARIRQLETQAILDRQNELERIRLQRLESQKSSINETFGGTGEAKKGIDTETHAKLLAELKKRKQIEAKKGASKSEAELRIERYSKLEVDELYNLVKAFLKKHGIEKQVIKQSKLEEYFGKNNIRKLIHKSYLVSTGKGVTVGK